MNHITDSGTIRAFEGDYPDEMDWVSLDWLKDEIKKQRKKHKNCTPDDCGACYVCDRFLALLEG